MNLLMKLHFNFHLLVLICIIFAISGFFFCNLFLKKCTVCYLCFGNTDDIAV